MVDDDEMEGAREPPSYSEASGSCVDDLFSESSFDLDRIRNLACFWNKVALFAHLSGSDDLT